MRSSEYTAAVAGMLFLAVSFAAGGRAATAHSFAPLQEWRAAVIAGDREALSKLYSANPPAVAQVGKTRLANLDDELRYWAAFKSGGMTEFNPKVLQITEAQGQTRLLLRVEASTAGVQQVASMLQVWTQQPNGWRMIASKRTDFSPNPKRQLPQPATPNTSLYSDPSEAQAELKAAEGVAAREHKRVLVVFGANWCYDCHVLDTTFRSKEFAPLVNANYVVVHVSIGDEGKDNQDLASRMGVALDKGVPSLAVLEPDGKVVVAQQGGEFESTVKIGPEEVRVFLEAWKPAH